MVDSGEWMEVHGAMMHRCVNGGRFGERTLINDKPRAASTRIISKALVCFHMKHEVFKLVGVQARDKPDVRSATENDAAEVTCLLSHAPVFFLLDRRRYKTGGRVRGEDLCSAKKNVKLSALLEHTAGGAHHHLLSSSAHPNASTFLPSCLPTLPSCLHSCLPLSLPLFLPSYLPPTFLLPSCLPNHHP